MTKREKEKFKWFYKKVYKKYLEADFLYVQFGDEATRREAISLKDTTNSLTTLWADELENGLNEIISWEMDVDEEFRRCKDWAL